MVNVAVNTLTTTHDSFFMRWFTLRIILGRQTSAWAAASRSVNSNRNLKERPVWDSVFLMFNINLQPSWCNCTLAVRARNIPWHFPRAPSEDHAIGCLVSVNWARHLWLRSPVALNAALSAVARGERRIWPRALQMLNDSGDWQVGIKLGRTPNTNWQ